MDAMELPQSFQLELKRRLQLLKEGLLKVERKGVLITKPLDLQKQEMEPEYFDYEDGEDSDGETTEENNRKGERRRNHIF